ncbi:COG4315 family predicted lipoprotein [Halococcus sp. AFM35]|uniref:COG4315 family predicted lipoprotein n=1 Tax=Halococcus sp. AFM35 TaxID=3421653 RepID=UPI003EBF2067
MNRRTLLHGLAAAGTTGLMGAVAGCLGGDGGGGNGGGATTADNGDSEPTADGQTTAAGGAQPSDGTTTGGATGTAAGGGTGGPTVAVTSHPELGDILVGPDGMTLYLFTEDSGGRSNCTGDCAEAWPPLTVDGEPTAGEGVTADLGTIERGDGSMQVTVGGTPLYYYAPDTQPGDATGQGVGGVWFVAAPDGSRISVTGTTTGSETTIGTDGGGGSAGGGGINY